METATLEKSEAAVRSGRRQHVIALMVVMFVAVLFRTVALSTIPPGLDPDEALNGNEAFAAHQAGVYPLFYPSNNGREGLFINLIGVSQSIFGAGFLGLRIPAAVIGSLTVLFVYLLGRELLGWRAAIFGSFLLATSFWHVLVSRTAFRAILMPLLLTSSLYLLVKAFGEESSIAGCGWQLRADCCMGWGFTPTLRTGLRRWWRWHLQPRSCISGEGGARVFGPGLR